MHFKQGMTCDLYYFGSSAKDDLERVLDWRQEGFYNMKAEMIRV